MHKTKILIVDGSEADRAALSEILGGEYEVLSPADCPGCLAVPGRIQPDTALRLLEQERRACARRVAELEQRADHDPMTGLLNREAARRRIAARLLSGPRGHAALALIDLDGFKAANDSRGHPFGDLVIREAARRLARGVRDTDILCRAGGDEFMVFWPDVQDLSRAAARVLDRLCGPFQGYRISAALGAARAEDAGRDYEALFAAADKALYAAKGDGPGRFRLYTPDRAPIRQSAR